MSVPCHSTTVEYTTAAVTTKPLDPSDSDLAFGDPLKAARTFVLLSQLSVEDLQGAGSAFERQRVNAQYLVASAVNHLTAAQAARASSAEVPDSGPRKRRSPLRLAGSRRRKVPVARVNAADELAGFALRLNAVAKALRLVGREDYEQTQLLAAELGTIFEQLGRT